MQLSVSTRFAAFFLKAIRFTGHPFSSIPCPAIKEENSTGAKCHRNKVRVHNISESSYPWQDRTTSQFHQTRLQIPKLKIPKIPSSPEELCYPSWFVPRDLLENRDLHPPRMQDPRSSHHGLVLYFSTSLSQ